MPNGGMPVFTLIATGWRYRKIFFYKKALVATYARCGGMFNIHLTTNIPRNLPVKKCVNRLGFDRFMVMSLWPRFWPTLYMKVTSGQRQRLGCTASMFSRRWCTVLKSGQSLSLLLGHLTLLTHGLPAKSFGNRISDTSRTLLSGWPPVSHGIREKRFRFFGHVARADPKQDHHGHWGECLCPAGKIKGCSEIDLVNFRVHKLSLLA